MTVSPRRFASQWQKNPWYNTRASSTGALRSLTAIAIFTQWQWMHIFSPLFFSSLFFDVSSDPIVSILASYLEEEAETTSSKLTKNGESQATARASWAKLEQEKASLADNDWTKHWNMPMGNKNAQPKKKASEGRNDLQYTTHQVWVGGQPPTHGLKPPGWWPVGHYGLRLLGAGRWQQQPLFHLTGRRQVQCGHGLRLCDHLDHGRGHHFLPGWTVDVLVDRFRLHRSGKRHSAGHSSAFQGS